MAKRARGDPEFARYALSGIEAAIEKMQRQAAELRNIVGASAAGVMAAVSGRRGRPAGSAPRAVGSGDNLASSSGSERSNAPTVDGGPTAPRKRTMSPEARRRISEAQKARWAKQKGQAGTESRKRGPKSARASGARRSKKRESALSTVRPR